MALEQDASSPSKVCMLIVEKEASTLSTLHRIANCVKNGTTRKIVSSNRCQRLACRPQLLSVKFENLVHSIFRNENSTLEINVSHFEVLHWQQWQPPASAPGYCFQNCFKHPCISTGFFLRVKLLKVVMKCKCFMEGSQEI